MSNDNLSNKIAVVTAGRTESARVLSEPSGATVPKWLLRIYKRKKGPGLATELGENARFVLLDVTDPGSWNSLVTQLSGNPRPP